jgi:hypothetical protein
VYKCTRSQGCLYTCTSTAQTSCTSCTIKEVYCIESLWKPRYCWNSTEVQAFTPALPPTEVHILEYRYGTCRSGRTLHKNNWYLYSRSTCIYITSTRRGNGYWLCALLTQRLFSSPCFLRRKLQTMRIVWALWFTNNDKILCR